MGWVARRKTYHMPLKTTTCVYWLAGRCNRNPCRFLHSLPSNASYTPHTYVRPHPYASNPLQLSSSQNLPHSSSVSDNKTDTVSDNKTDTVSDKKNNPLQLSSSQNLPHSSSVSDKKTDTVSNTVSEKKADTVSEKKADTVSDKNTGTVSDQKTDTISDQKSDTISDKKADSVSDKKIDIVSDKQTDAVSDKKADHPSPKSSEGRDGTQMSDVSLRTVCRFWMNNNGCIHGGDCANLHSWFSGDGISIIAKLQGHEKLVTGIALPVGSDKLYSGSSDGTLRAWDCHTGQCIGLNNLGAEVTCLVAEGSWIFAALGNGTIMVCNIQTATQFTLNGPKGRIIAVIVGHDTLFAAAEDGVIYAWRGSSDANSPLELVASLTGHTKSVVCLTVGCKKVLYSGSMDQTIKVWDLDTLECTTTLHGHTDVVTSLICWGDYLLSGSSDSTIKVWFATEERTLKVLYSHAVDNGVVALSRMIDAEGKHVLICSSRDSSVHLYELPSFSERALLFAKKEVGSLAIGPDGLFFTGDRSGLVTVWKWL